jgi:molybdopterin synthase catalytic subunit
VGGHWVGTGWALGGHWVGTGWALGGHWVGTGWAGTGWAGTGWAGTGWAGTGWAGTGWAGTGWAGTGWAGTGWGGSAAGTVSRVEVVRLVEIRDTPLSVAEVLAAVADPAAGGTAVFCGHVRDHDQGRQVTRLSYTAHVSAGDEMRRVAEKVAAGSGALAVAVVHRAGELAIGDLAVVAAVACPHRGDAFAVCQALIDEIKVSVPIWKNQHFAGGGAEWVGSA